MWDCPDFLDLPRREQKPRDRGLTHVLDKGQPVDSLEHLLVQTGHLIDVLKVGWGIAYIDPSAKQRVARCDAAGVMVSLGGTLLEICAAQGKVDEMRRWAADLGVHAVEVSNGLECLSPRAKTALIRSLTADFVVLAETGAKDGHSPVVADQWLAEMEADLDAGARWVIAEGRESGTVGVYDEHGKVREALVEAIIGRVPADRVIFEAPLKHQQLWFIEHLGPDVNLGNVPTSEIIALETLRLGLRADTRSDRAPAMIETPAPNTITRPYRGLSVQETDVPLTEVDLVPWLLGREVYRRTDYLVLRNHGDTALVALRKESLEPLFSPVVEARLLAGPAQVVWIESPDTDVGNATALARAALAHPHTGALAYVVLGRYEHVNFIWSPAPVTIHVTEVVPPEPAKLFAMAEQVVAFDEDLPPVDLVLDAVDIREIAGAHPAERYLLPCRGAGVDLDGALEFLDTRPADRQDWLMIGCERSLQFHRHFYGDEPARVDICPRKRTESGALPDGSRALTKCCLIERGVELADGEAVVPWGTNLDEIRTALRHLTGVEQPVQAETR